MQNTFLRKAIEPFFILNQEVQIMYMTAARVVIPPYLKSFYERVVELKSVHSDGYRQIGKYRVKETFAGEESLTSLLTQYVERTVSLGA